jgi:hypothetical protein
MPILSLSCLPLVYYTGPGKHVLPTSCTDEASLLKACTPYALKLACTAAMPLI